MTHVYIRALAKLARLETSDTEVAQLEKEIPQILQFVDQIQKVDTSRVKAEAARRNIMREDAGAHEGGVYTDALLAAAPKTKDGRIVVKQVVSRTKK